MILYVANPDFIVTGVIDGVSSIIWSERYTGNGDFEIYTTASNDMVELLIPGNYIMRHDSDCVMIIEKVALSTSVEDGDYLTVTGRSAESIISRRIVWSQTNLYGKVEMCIRQLLIENIIDPVIPERKIDNFILGDIQGFTETMRMQVTGDNLQDVIDDICTTYGIGYRVRVQDGKFIFDLYRGVDRSYNQTSIPFVVFSPEFDNLLNSDYEFDLTAYKNVVLVAGEGEGTERKTQAVGTATGLNRYEMYADARNMSTNDETITDEEYREQLTQSGVETLAENQAVESFTGGVEYYAPYECKNDYFLGDVVQVINEYGIGATPRIIETIESEDENGYNLTPTFEYNGGA